MCNKEMTETFDEEDDINDDDPPEEIYDREGNVVWSQYYEGTFVECKCSGCGCTFQGLPIYSYCNGCADKIERGWDLEG